VKILLYSPTISVASPPIFFDTAASTLSEGGGGARGSVGDTGEAAALGDRAGDCPGVCWPSSWVPGRGVTDSRETPPRLAVPTLEGPCERAPVALTARADGGRDDRGREPARLPRCCDTSADRSAAASLWPDGGRAPLTGREPPPRCDDGRWLLAEPRRDVVRTTSNWSDRPNQHGRIPDQLGCRAGDAANASAAAGWFSDIVGLCGVGLPPAVAEVLRAQQLLAR